MNPQVSLSEMRDNSYWSLYGYELYFYSYVFLLYFHSESSGCGF